jgi:hypothetical protein
VCRAPVAERKALRDQHVRPLIEEFFDWVHAARSTTPGRNLATKALGYARGRSGQTCCRAAGRSLK